MRFENDTSKGYYDKYEVKRKDESSNHPDCEYFVLDLTHDPIARAVALEYARRISNENPWLSMDLKYKIQLIESEL